jgi:uncharacterized membrane protein
LSAEEASHARIKVRIEALSDLVFGLALSIGSLEFLSNPAKKPTGLIDNVAFFGFSFLILVFVWLGYTRTMMVLPREGDQSLALNITLLFLVALEPYLFFELVTSSLGFENFISIAYALDVGTMFFIQAALARLVILEDQRSEKLGEKRVNPIIVQRFGNIFKSEIAIGAIYLASTLPIFWDVLTPIGPLRYLLWWSSFGVFAARGRRKAELAKTSDSPA